MEIEIGDKVYCEKNICENIYQGGVPVELEGIVCAIAGDHLHLHGETMSFSVNKKYVVKVEKGII